MEAKARIIVPLDVDRISRTLHECGVILTNDHFVLTSWRHAASYFNKDALYKHPIKAQLLYQEIANHFFKSIQRLDHIEVIAAPAIGGALFAQNVGRLLSCLLSSPGSQKEVITVFAEEESGGAKIFKRAYAKEIPGKNVLILEDVLTTGGSALAVIREVRRLNGKVVGLGVLCDRRDSISDILDGIEIFALVTSKDLSYVDWSTFDEAECPLCRAGIPINTEVGKGREFLARRRQAGKDNYGQ